MKQIKLLLGIVLAFSVLVVPVAAQEEDVDRVLLASEANYPDAVVGSSVSEKLSVPVVLTDVDQIPEEAEGAIEEYAPEEVVVIGGPSVVSDEIVDQLEEDYNVSRLWGVTRYRTAQEVMERFWPEGTDEAVLVEDNIEDKGGEVLAKARDLAGERPVIPIPEGKIPAGVLNQLEEMDTNEVDVVATEISEEMRQDLEEVDVGLGEEVTAQNREQLKEEVQDRTREDLEGEDSLLAVASQGHRDVISGLNSPGRPRYMISSEEEIQGLVDLVGEEDIQEVKIVGDPDLTGEIADALEETDANVDLVVERASTAVAQASELARENRPDFAEKFAQKNEQWEQRVQEREVEIEERVRKELNRTKGATEDWDGTELEGKVEEAEEAMEQGDYQEAMEIAQEARSEARKMRYEEFKDYPEDVNREVRKEMMNIRERTQELREINQEFGDRMQNNMTMEGRLETIENVRERRHEKVGELLEDAMRRGREKAKPSFIL